MTAPLFLVGRDGLSSDTVLLSGREGHHAADVRRLRTGEKVDVSDGFGIRLGCRVVSTGRGEVVLAVESRLLEPAPVPRLVVAQALIKQDAAERALAAMTEVGVDAIIPWAAHRSVVTWDGERIARGLRRWRAGVVEAAKQSRRAWVPEVTTPVDSAGLSRRVGEAGLALLLDSAAADPLAEVGLSGVEDVLVIVGPEGGLTEEETTALRDAGARAVHLGPTILRSATAGTVAVAVALARTARWASRDLHAPAG